MVEACPGRSPSVTKRVEAFVAFMADERSAPLGDDEPDPQPYLGLVARVCADPTVFEDAATVTASARPAMVWKRCDPNSVGLGDDTRVVFDGTGMLGFVLYQDFLDRGVTPDLAQRFVVTMSELAASGHGTVAPSQPD